MNTIQEILASLPHVDPALRSVLTKTSNSPFWTYEKITETLQPKSLLEIGPRQGLVLISALRGTQSIDEIMWVENEAQLANANQMCVENIQYFFSEFEDAQRADRTNVQAYSSRYDLLKFRGKVIDIVLVNGDQGYEDTMQDLLVCEVLKPKFLLVGNLQRSGSQDAVRDWSESMGTDFFMIHAYKGVAFFDFSTEQDAKSRLERNGLDQLINRPIKEPEIKQCWCGGEVKEWGNSPYGRCDRCGTLVLKHAVDEETLKEFYTFDGYWHDYVQGEYNFPTIEQRAINDFKDRIPLWYGIMSRYKQNPESVLEIGCSHGGFLRACKELGAINVVGVEVDASTCEFARDLFGLEHVISGFFPNVELPLDKFDVVAGFDVLEHFSDPVEAMERVNDLLTPDGVCIFATPCHRGEGESWEQLKPREHLFLYSAHNIHLLFDQVGMCLVGVLPGVNPDEMFVIGKKKSAVGSGDFKSPAIDMNVAKMPIVTMGSSAFVHPTGKKVVAIGLVEHFGDIVACEPVSRYMRSMYPNEHIVWVTGKQYQELVDANPYLDEILLVDCLTDWIKLVNHNHFDFIIDLHVNKRVCPSCRIPLDKKTGNPDITGENYYRYGSLLAAASQAAGLYPLFESPNVYINDRVSKAVDLLELPSSYVVIHCSSNERDRDWDDQKWNILVGEITERYGIHVVEVGIKPIVRSVSNAYVNLCGKLSLMETAEVLRRSSLFIGVDSGPAHLANAVKTPGVVLLGEYRSFKTYVPYGGEYASGLNAKLTYSKAGHAFEIGVDEALDSISHFLNHSGSTNTESVG